MGDIIPQIDVTANGDHCSSHPRMVRDCSEIIYIIADKLLLLP